MPAGLEKLKLSVAGRWLWPVEKKAAHGHGWLAQRNILWLKAG